MPRYPLVQIVDAPTAGAAVLYDFQDDSMSLSTGSRTGLHDQSWSFGDLNLLGDPDAVGVDWALRRVSFTQEITGTKSAALARQAAMSKALLRRRFWFRFQLTASTTPVYWYAYRTPPGNLSLEQVYTSGALSDHWLISGVIDVDPFSFAERITQATRAVGNNPANEATIPSVGYALPTIKGDAPSALRVKITPSVVPSLAFRYMVALISTSYTNPVLRVPIGISDDFGTGGAGYAAAGASNTQAIGGSSRTVTFTSTSPVTRLSGNISPTGLRRGRYMLLLRVAGKPSSGGSGAVTLTFRTTSSTSGAAIGPAVSATWTQPSAAVENYQYVNLGTIAAGGDGLPADVATSTGGPFLDFAIASSDAAATAVLDDLMLVPISGTDVTQASVLNVEVTSKALVIASERPIWIDGDEEVAWCGDIPDAYRVTAQGGFPKVDPAAAVNTLLVLPVAAAVNPIPSSDNSAGRVTTLTGTSTVVVSYQPRSSWIGDGAT